MKKLFALTLALLMALSCVIASAETVNIHLTIDRDQAASLSPQDSQKMTDTVLALVNALGVNVITDAEGVQIDLDLKGQSALSLGFATTGQGLSVVSTLFPNYMVTISTKTLEQYAKSMADMVTSKSGASTQDMAAISEAFTGYATKFGEAISASATLGTPVTGNYEYEGYAFDTMVPVTVDVPAASEALKTFVNDILNDKAIMSAVEASAKSSGQEFDAKSFKSDLDEMLTHCPDTVTAEYYCFSDNSSPAFYLVGEARYTGKDQDSYAYSLLHREDNGLTLMVWDYEHDMQFSFQYSEGAFRIDCYSGDDYYGFDMTFTTGDPSQVDINVYYQNPEKPLANLAFTSATGGTHTLSLDQGSRTVVALEDIMENSDNAEGLVNDIMNNGLGTLMAVIQAVPEASNLMSLFM